MVFKNDYQKRYIRNPCEQKSDPPPYKGSYISLYILIYPLKGPYISLRIVEQSRNSRTFLNISEHF